MPSPPKTQRDVSANNPCPFLRALVADAQLPDGTVSIGDVTKTILDTAKTGDGAPQLPSLAIRAIALIANGLGPNTVLRNAFLGVHLNELRGGPFDKKGAGSRILDVEANINMAELERLDQFASDKVDADGLTERGLSLDELNRMMDTNFARAAGHRRSVDRRLMESEWPVLLKVMGKKGKTGRYLSLAEVKELFVERRLPARMLQRQRRT